MRELSYFDDHFRCLVFGDLASGFSRFVVNFADFAKHGLAVVANQKGIIEVVDGLLGLEILLGLFVIGFDLRLLLVVEDFIASRVGANKFVFVVKNFLFFL